MIPMRIALIACDNGLGHIRRMLSLSLALRSQGAHPVLFAPKKAVEKLAEIYNVYPPEIINFESKTTRSDWLSTNDNYWIRALPSLSSFDKIISDNLVEILEYWPKAWLSGSFFWHMAIANFPPYKAVRAESLLASYRPKMVSTDLFAAPYLASKTELKTVGLYALGILDEECEKSDLLISCGKGGQIEQTTKAFLRTIASGAKPGAFTVWIEPSFYCNSMPNWMQPASYTPAMYKKLVAGVIRPGVGTASDLLIAGAKLFMFYESNNYEMVHNANRIVDIDFGESFNNIQEAWFRCVGFAQQKNLQDYHFSRIRPFEIDGAQQAAKLLIAEND